MIEWMANHKLLYVGLCLLFVGLLWAGEQLITPAPHTFNPDTEYIVSVDTVGWEKHRTDLRVDCFGQADMLAFRDTCSLYWTAQHFTSLANNYESIYWVDIWDSAWLPILDSTFAPLKPLLLTPEEMKKAKKLIAD